MSYRIDQDALWPRDADHRYRIYARRGRSLDVLAACPDPGGIGVALVQLDEDERRASGGTLGDRGAIGVLDVVDGRWIVLPWHRPDHHR